MSLPLSNLLHWLKVSERTEHEIFSARISHMIKINSVEAVNEMIASIDDACHAHW